MPYSMDVRKCGGVQVLYVEFEGDVGRSDMDGALADAVPAIGEHGLKCTLIDMRKQTSPVMLLDTFDVHVDMVHKLPSSFAIAVVTTPEQLSDMKFAENVAVNRGGIYSIYNTPEEAIDWLNSLACVQ